MSKGIPAYQSECRIEYPHVDKMPLTVQKPMLEDVGCLSD